MAEQHICERHTKGVCAKCEAIELAIVCAQDIIEAWPEFSLRKTSQMTKMMDTLRQALEAAKK